MKLQNNKDEILSVVTMVVSPFHPEEIPDVPVHHVLLNKFAEHGDKVAIVSSSQIKLWFVYWTVISVLLEILYLPMIMCVVVVSRLIQRVEKVTLIYNFLIEWRGLPVGCINLE